jgi:hypothetical protein
MREHLTAVDLYALLLMMASADHRLLILVEDDSDAIVLDRVLDLGSVTTVPGYGKATVLGAMDLYEKGAAELRTIAFVDRDFAGLGIA